MDGLSRAGKGRTETVQERRPKSNAVLLLALPAGPRAPEPVSAITLGGESDSGGSSSRSPQCPITYLPSNAHEPAVDVEKMNFTKN
ncbi:MAG: hypothetical protein O7H41_21380 [Planctomycetota bacterium]|nr:hypothetical protein [Planctomycetota bacterium]